VTISGSPFVNADGESTGLIRRRTWHVAAGAWRCVLTSAVLTSAVLTSAVLTSAVLTSADQPCPAAPYPGGGPCLAEDLRR
jgi:hypothetical protein